MNKQFSPRLWLRFSLRTLLIFCVLSSLVIAWVSTAQKHHRVEQQFIERLVKTLPSNGNLHVTTHEQTVTHGHRLM